MGADLCVRPNRFAPTDIDESKLTLENLRRQAKVNFSSIYPVWSSCFGGLRRGRLPLHRAARQFVYPGRCFHHC